MEEIKEALIESSILVCKGCGETKTRIMDGRYANRKDVRWVDPESKRQWSGHTCPDCHARNVAQRKRNKSRLVSNG